MVLGGDGQQQQGVRMRLKSSTLELHHPRNPHSDVQLTMPAGSQGRMVMRGLGVGATDASPHHGLRWTVDATTQELRFENTEGEVAFSIPASGFRTAGCGGPPCDQAVLILGSREKAILDSPILDVGNPLTRQSLINIGAPSLFFLFHHLL